MLNFRSELIHNCLIAEYILYGRVQFTVLTSRVCQILMGNCPSPNVQISDIQTLKPHWACAVRVRKEYINDKISEFTSGLRAINSNTIENTGTGTNRIEGARWSRGFTSGQHIIEFIYPVHTRGPGSRVGIGPITTPLGGNDKKTVVGGKLSWALDLVERRILQDGKAIGEFPPWKMVLPDWFFMYIDLDAGAVHFGSDGEYYGTAFTNVTTTATMCLYPMVTTTVKGAIVGIVYRGQDPDETAPAGAVSSGSSLFTGKEVTGPLRKKRTLAADSSSSHARSCRKSTYNYKK